MLADYSCANGAALVLWILAAVCAVYGVISLVRGAIIMGIVLILVAFAVGPGGFSIFC